MKILRIWLSYISLALCASLALGACQARGNDVTAQSSTTALLTECADLGQGYIDSFIFFGESTTYHLKSRGVLSGGTRTAQVWGTRGGTACLDATISSLRIIYPKTGEELSLSEAFSRERPKRVLLTFGLNGAVSKVRSGEEYFKLCYLELIDTVRHASPRTEIYLQSCFPVAATMDTSAYGVDAATLNEYIRTINAWTLSLAEQESLWFLNSYEVMADESGALRVEFDSGDGYHLSRSAYEEMLKYMRTHSFEVDK